MMVSGRQAFSHTIGRRRVLPAPDLTGVVPSLLILQASDLKNGYRLTMPVNSQVIRKSIREFQMKKMWGFLQSQLFEVRFWFDTVLFFSVVLFGLRIVNFDPLNSGFWNAYYEVFSPLLSGALVSFLFYFLVVWLPESRRRKLMKNNLRSMYASIKEDILWNVVFASQKGGRRDLSTNLDEVRKLLIVKNFRAAFQVGGESDEGFYAFRNYMSEDVEEFREILTSLRLLQREIEFILHNYAITDADSFSALKRLEAFFLAMDRRGPGYMEEKALSTFIWQIFGGFDIAKGDVGHDFIENLIEDL